MATLTIKNVPEPLVRRLKHQATRHRRSLNLEVIWCLERAVQAAPLDVDEILARARSVRRTPAGPTLTDALLERLRSTGRP